MLFFKYKSNDLFCENIKVSDICKKFETPFYLYSSNALVNNYKNLDKLRECCFEKHLGMKLNCMFRLGSLHYIFTGI